MRSVWVTALQLRRAAAWRVALPHGPLMTSQRWTSSAPPQGMDETTMHTMNVGMRAHDDESLPLELNLPAPCTDEWEVEKEAAKSDPLNPTARTTTQRRRRRKRTMDNILGEVLHDALKLRDMGKKPSADFVYKRAQERIYEEEYGHKPPSAKDNRTKFIPFPPDMKMVRLLPLQAGDQEPSPTQRMRGYDGFSLLEEDPWPERAITPTNPVWSKQYEKADKEAGGAGLKAWERRMFDPREGFDVVSEFLDAMDELAFWEIRLLQFIRTSPLPLRRSLPFLHEWHRYLVHRTIRAERRYLRCRDVALSTKKAKTSIFSRTEECIERIRNIYAEAHRSLSSPNYDPLRMKKSTLAPFMKMNEEEFNEWSNKQREQRNLIIADLD